MARAVLSIPSVPRGLPWSLAVLAMCAACASQPPPAPPPPVVPSPPYRLVDTTPPLAGSSIVEFVQNERPDGCVGTLQPAVVDMQVAGDSSTPVWRCLAGCGPGLEYVSVLRHHRGRTSIRIDCHPVCGAGSRRTEHVTEKSAPGRTCAPGDPPDAAMHALASDQERQRRWCIAVRRLALASAEQAVVRAEQDPSSMATAKEKLKAIPQTCDGRRDPDYYGSYEEASYPAERERVLAIAAPDLAERARSLAARLDRVQAAAQKLAEVARAAATARAEQAQRALAPCYRACESARVRCVALCTKDVTWGACAACQPSEVECRHACEEPHGENGPV